MQLPSRHHCMTFCLAQESRAPTPSPGHRSFSRHSMSARWVCLRHHSLHLLWLTLCANPVDPALLATELRQHMTRLRQFRQPAMPPWLHSCIATSRSAPTSSSIRTQCAGL
jgi:hypothetical protein